MSPNTTQNVAIWAQKRHADIRHMELRIVINLMDQLVVSLPPCLTLTVRKPREEEDKEPHPNPKKTKRNKDNQDPKDRRVVNEHAPVAFRLLDNEDYKSTFANKHIEARPKWNDKCRMCRHWFTLGYCFANCKHKDGHIPECEIPADRKIAYGEFLVIARRNWRCGLERSCVRPPPAPNINSLNARGTSTIVRYSSIRQMRRGQLALIQSPIRKSKKRKQCSGRYLWGCHRLISLGRFGRLPELMPNQRVGNMLMKYRVSRMLLHLSYFNCLAQGRASPLEQHPLAMTVPWRIIALRYPT